MTAAAIPDRIARGAASMAGHGTTRTGQFRGREALQFVYPPLTTASMAAGRLATLFGTRSLVAPTCSDLPLLIAP